MMSVAQTAYDECIRAELALTDSESDNATAPRKPAHPRIVASFQSIP